MAEPAPDRYAVMGHPIGHSRSPFIHRRFAEQTGQHLTYEAIDVAPEAFPQAVADFRQAGGKGLNITVPLKEQAWHLAALRSARAERAGAVNTLLWQPDDRLYGDNTDGIGLVRDLVRNLGLRLHGRQVLLLGAGGAARGILEPLLRAEPERLVIVNRTRERAERLADLFADLGQVSACGYGDLGGQVFDGIIHATAAGLAGEVPPLPDDVVGPETWCYDLMYGSEPTAFVAWARAHGAHKAVDGLGMLVEQAAESFYLWRGVRPQTRPVITELRGGS